MRLAAAAALAAALSACTGHVSGHWEDGPAPGSSADPTPGGPANDPVVQLQIMPGKTHSGFDGMHEFRVPVAVYGAKSPTLTASDPSMVAIAPATLADTSQDNGTYFFVTAKKTGTVTLTASVKGGSVSATLDITPYTMSEYATGEQRYMNAASSGPACVSCHGGSSGIDHSPSTMASATDGDVVSVITTGILVEGNPITQVRHKWAVTDAEAKGLVAYLRALPPRGFTN